ncbi:hypothetical protein Dimus_033800 [Dionaea muscipula]
MAADLGLQLQQGRGGGAGALPLPPLSDIVNVGLAIVDAGPVFTVEWATGFREGHNNAMMKDGKMDFFRKPVSFDSIRPTECRNICHRSFRCEIYP